MSGLVRVLALLTLLFGLAGCGGFAEPVWAPDDAVAKAAYHDPGPKRITLFTVVSTRNGSGAHSGLLINADQRILFDPAGTFKLPWLPERNDVFFGMDDNALKVYIDYHARVTFNVVQQQIDVTPEQARIAAQLVQEYGAVPKAQCSLAISRILRQVPGFESIGVTFFPVSLEHEFGRIPGVTTKIITDNDADHNHNVLFTAAKEHGLGG